MQIYIRLTIAVPLSFLMAATTALCQDKSIPRGTLISATEASHLLRSGRAPVSAIVFTLSQGGGRVEAASIKALGDSLTVIAMESPSVVSDQSRRNAISALGLAGHPVNGTPYAGSAAALFRIATQPGNSNAQRALANLGKNSDYVSVEKYLGQIAASGRREAADAIILLDIAMEKATRPNSVLRQLWDSSTITEAYACEAMRSVALRHKWPESPTSSCRWRPPEGREFCQDLASSSVVNRNPQDSQEAEQSMGELGSPHGALRAPQRKALAENASNQHASSVAVVR